MNAFACIIKVSTKKGAHRNDVIEALKRCLVIELADGEDPSPIEGVSVLVDTVTPYDTAKGEPTVYLL